MSQGFIDSTSLHNVILAFRHPKPLEWTPWSWEVLEGVTCALWGHPQFQIAPDPSLHQGAHGTFGKLLEKLSPSFSGIAPQDQHALELTKRWIHENPKRVQSKFEEVKNSISFQQWLDEYMAFFFVRHSEMHGALFTYEFIPQLSEVLDCSPAELSRVHELTRNPDEVKRWVRKKPNTEDFRLAVEAFSLATLLRGRYHDHAARNSNVLILHHPMRVPMLSPKKPTSEFLLSNTEQYLTKIVFTSALAEPKLEGKIGVWSENVFKIRTAVALDRLDLRQKEIDSVALELAIDAAKRSDIRVHPRYLEVFLDAAVSLGISTLTSFSLAPWYVTLPMAVGEFVVSRSFKLGERVSRRLYLSEKHLRDLATSEPGRVQSTLLNRPK